MVLSIFLLAAFTANSLGAVVTAGDIAGGGPLTDDELRFHTSQVLNSVFLWTSALLIYLPGLSGD